VSENRETTLLNPANLVTISRIGMLMLLAFAIKVNVPAVRIGIVIMIPVLFYLDSLDGYLARHFNCSTKLGSVLDVAGDRIVENVLWLILAYFHVIPIWIPVLLIVRGFLTDGFRSVAIAQGHTTFSMMKSKIGWWMVASPLSRTSYAILKAVVFTLGIAIWGFKLSSMTSILTLFHILVALTVLQSLARGFFSIKESAKTLSSSHFNS